jgi:hypothetical protein
MRFSNVWHLAAVIDGGITRSPDTTACFRKAHSLPRNLAWSTRYGNNFERCDLMKRPLSIHTAGGDETMHVRMNAHSASPCVQRGNDAWFGTEILWIGEELFEGLPCSGHQLVSKECAIELPEHIELFGDGEDDVSVITREQVGRCFL